MGKMKLTTGNKDREPKSNLQRCSLLTTCQSMLSKALLPSEHLEADTTVLLPVKKNVRMTKKMYSDSSPKVRCLTPHQELYFRISTSASFRKVISSTPSLENVIYIKTI